MLNGDKVTGLTTFYINEKIDQGDIIYQSEYNISDTITFNALYHDLSILSQNILLKTISIIQNNKDNYKILDIKSDKKAPKINKNDFIINWNKSAYDIHNQIRALSYKGAYGFYKSKRIKFYNTYFIKNTLNLNIKMFTFKNNMIYIGTADGILSSNMIQLEGRDKITAMDFKNVVKTKINSFD